MILPGGIECCAVDIMLDGLSMPDLGYDHEALIDGDALCLSISAAGIIAKTVRDRLMVALDGRHAGYQWVTNRGYGTAARLFTIAGRSRRWANSDWACRGSGAPDRRGAGVGAWRPLTRADHPRRTGLSSGLCGAVAQLVEQVAFNH